MGKVLCIRPLALIVHVQELGNELDRRLGTYIELLHDRDCESREKLGE